VQLPRRFPGIPPYRRNNLACKANFIYCDDWDVTQAAARSDVADVAAYQDAVDSGQSPGGRNVN
jgi:hypothetical protein